MVEGDFLEKLQRLSLTPVNQTRGHHGCEFCLLGRSSEVTIEVRGKIMRLGSTEL
jgi:hypothetical protein